MPIIRLRFTLGVLRAKQVCNCGETRSIAVLQNPQTLCRLIDGGPHSLQGLQGRLALNVSLIHLQPDLLLIGSQLSIHPRLDRLFLCKLSAFAEGENIDADLHSGHPAVSTLSPWRLPV